MIRRPAFLISVLVLAWSSAAAAFVPPPCSEDSSRTIFAGAFGAPCKKFHGDQASCELAYYLNRRGEAVSCAYVEGTCIGCGGRNAACTVNTCSGDSNGLAATECIGDSDRTALLGNGGNDSQRCRNLDQTDQATCENAYYRDDDDDSVFGDAVACFWSSGDGSCLGCGNNGSACPFNVCDPTAVPADAECTLDAGRTTLIGFGGNGSRRCRRLDDTDQATCESAFYEDENTGLPVACWWDGNDCRGSGFDDFFAWNTCLSSAAPPVATATCTLDPGRTNLLGFGANDTGACRQLDDTDQATCENAYYEDAAFGSAVACWWDGDDCRGSFSDEDGYHLFNACQIAVQPATATCPGRGNLLGFGHNDTNICRTLDDTDQATCENAFYQSVRHGGAVACKWDGDDCRGCAGRNEDCTENACVTATCAGEPTRMNFIGFGANGTGSSGGACRQFADQTSCEDSYYLSLEKGQGVGCWWDGSVCRGTTSRPENDACLVDTDCTREPDRTLLGFGGSGQSPCRALDPTDETTCEGAYYEHFRSGQPVACWWAAGDLCLGSWRRNDLQNSCLRQPPTAAATCGADVSRTTLVGFGRNGSGDQGSACRSLDGTDEPTCESSFYEHAFAHVGVACWWDAGICRGTSRDFTLHNTCLQPITCTHDPDRATFLGLGSNGIGNDGHACRSLDGTDEATCVDAFYAHDESGAPVACWWNGSECRGSADRHFQNNECFYDEVPAGAAATCDSRTNLLGFGNDGSRPCRVLDDTDQSTCEEAYYQHDDHGYGVACWWDGFDCRGSARNNSTENVCDPDVPCFLQPGRTNLLGFGNNESSICAQLSGTDQANCENAYYVNDDTGDPIACWWDAGICRGSSEGYSAFNACLRNPSPPVTCDGRSTSLGFGHNDSGRCRQLDGTSEGTCEDAFYQDNRFFDPVACTWAAGADQCLGTVRWESLNACDPSAPLPPECADATRTAFIGRGGKDGLGRSGGACRQLDSTDETTCETAYYQSREGDPIACWWDGADCRGTNRMPRAQHNECVPAVSCDGRTTLAGFGANDSEPCRAFDFTDQATCEDAYYVEGRSGFPVACAWTGSGDCFACGRRGGRGQCLTNACNPLTCFNDPGRTQVRACRELNSQAACENAWHVLGDRDLPPLAASCAWDAAQQRCFGCGPPAQAHRECANTCETGCGNGVLDGGETCDDGNMYDGDCCDSTCQLESDGSPCTDRLFCTVGPGTCAAGECVGAAPRICASCLGNDCSEFSNSCEFDGRSPTAVGAQLQGMAPTMAFPLPPGTECNDGIAGTESACNGGGQCFLVLAPPTPTAAATATATATPVPIGGACDNSSECVDGAACVDGFCAEVLNPVPATSNRALFLIVAALLGVAAIRFGIKRSGAGVP